MAKPVIGIDLDDVIIDFVPALCQFHNKHYGTTHTFDDITSFHLSSLWGCAPEETARRIMQFYESPEHAAAQPVRDAVASIRALHQRAEVVVITARAESTREITEVWLEEHIPSLTSAVRYTGQHVLDLPLTKGNVCKQLGVDLFIDDATHNAEDVAPVVTTSLLFDTPWNRGHVSEYPNVHRVHSWTEVMNKIALLF